jgi:hypothetical protein
MVRISQLKRFDTRNLVLGKVHVHLVTVEVGIVGVAVGVVHANGFFPWQNPNSVTHDGGLVERRLPVHQDHITVGQVPMDLLVPLAAEVVPGRGKELVRQRNAVLERLCTQVDDLAVLVLNGRGAGPLV